MPDRARTPWPGGPGGDELHDDEWNAHNNDADILTGGSGDDVILSFGGDDSLRGGPGDDFLESDDLSGDAPAAVLFGEDGQDTLAVYTPVGLIDGGSGYDTLDLFVHFDVDERTPIDVSSTIIQSVERLQTENISVALTSTQLGAFSEVIGTPMPLDLDVRMASVTLTTSGSVDLSGKVDADRLEWTGSAGADRVQLADTDSVDLLFSGRAGNDFVRSGGGDYTLSGGRGDDTLGGGDGTDRLHGGTGRDALYGYAGRDFLYGESGNDRLHGGSGDDRLEGGAGDDTLIGDVGADVFVVRPGGFDPSNFRGQVDTVLDFEAGTDKLWITGFGKAYDSPKEILAASWEADGNTYISLDEPTGAFPLATTIVLQGFTGLGAADFIA
ncbi:MAG: calcium-binding protein [Geminicoccaceae bacterium]